MSGAGLRGLPTIDPGEAELRRAVIEAVTGRRIGDALLVADIGSRRDDRGDWLVFTNGVAIAFDLVDRRAARLSAADGLYTAATLDRAEPILREIEAALGIDLDPVEVVAAPPAAAIIAAITAADQAKPVHRLRIALPPTLALLAQAGPLAPELLGRLALAATITVAGPRLAPHDAAGLAAGDCILLGGRLLAATLSVRGVAEIGGALDPASDRFVCR